MVIIGVTCTWESIYCQIINLRVGDESSAEVAGENTRDRTIKSEEPVFWLQLLELFFANFFGEMHTEKVSQLREV